MVLRLDALSRDLSHAGRLLLGDGARQANARSEARKQGPRVMFERD